MTEPAVTEAPSPEAAETRFCSTCRTALNRLGAQPIRTGGLPNHPDAVLWLDTQWCPRCGRVEFFTARGPDDGAAASANPPA